MKKKDNTLRIMLGVIVAILVVCTVMLMAARTQRMKDEDPIAHPTYMGQEIYSTKWRG